LYRSRLILTEPECRKPVQYLRDLRVRRQVELLYLPELNPLLTERQPGCEDSD
jgi:hypothetical protein